MSLIDFDQRLRARDTVAYVIEVGETQAGLVSRDAGEGYFTFIAASRAFDALDRRRFATPLAAERAARDLTRRSPHRLSS